MRSTHGLFNFRQTQEKHFDSYFARTKQLKLAECRSSGPHFAKLANNAGFVPIGSTYSEFAQSLPR